MRAFLFDLDGTLIDSMPHHQAAWDVWHERNGIKAPDGDFFASTAGRSNAEILADLFPAEPASVHAAMADEKEAIYRELAAPSLGLIDGAEAFVRQAREAGLKLAICTASTPLNMALAFGRHGIDGWVEVVVSPADRASGAGIGTGRGDLLRGKPYPDIFLEAAHRLGIEPADCLVFEDAPLGVEAARRAGMKAVALTTTMPAAGFESFDNLLAIAADFNGLSLAELSAAPGCAHPGARSTLPNQTS